MATLAVIVWIAGLVQVLRCSAAITADAPLDALVEVIGARFQLSRPRVLGLFVYFVWLVPLMGVAVASWLLSGCVVLDIYGEFPRSLWLEDLPSPEAVRFGLLHGLTFLGIGTLFSAIASPRMPPSGVHARHGAAPENSVTWSRVTQVVGFISSVLGIIGFYLQFAK